MATTITFNSSNDDETKPIIQTQIAHPYLLNPSGKILKQFPPTIIQSIEADREKRSLPISQSHGEFLSVKRSSLDTTDDDLEEESSQTTSLPTHRHYTKKSNTRRIPSEIRITLHPDEQLINSQLDVSDPRYKNELRCSDPSLLDPKNLKLNRVDYIRRSVIGRRIHSSFSSSATLRSLGRRRSTQNISPRLLNTSSTTISRSRRQVYHLPRNSKWHIVRHRLHDIAMMNESYARMKALEQDKRWENLREKIRAQVLDMREMSILRQQDDGLIAAKKPRKKGFNLKTIPANELIHVERDGKVYSMSTRDLVLGRLIGAEDIQLDTFAQLDARRQLQVQQSLVEQQEGRTRLKKHIAFSFCLCNLSFIVLMFAAMFIFAMKTIIELRSRDFL
jgi:hypothetical protein